MATKNYRLAELQGAYDPETEQYGVLMRYEALDGSDSRTVESVQGLEDDLPSLEQQKVRLDLLDSTTDHVITYTGSLPSAHVRRGNSRD